MNNNLQPKEKSKSINPISANKKLKAKEDVAHTKKHLFLVSLNGVVKFTLKSSLIALKPLYKALYVVVLILIASSTQMGQGYNGLVACVIKSIIESAMEPINLSTARAILTV